MGRGIPLQQNPTDVDLVILLPEARSNRLEDVAILVDKAKATLAEAQPDEVVRVATP